MKPHKRLRPLIPAERLHLKRLDVAREWQIEQRKRFRIFKMIKPKGNSPKQAKG